MYNAKKSVDKSQVLLLTHALNESWLANKFVISSYKERRQYINIDLSAIDT